MACEHHCHSLSLLRLCILDPSNLSSFLWHSILYELLCKEIVLSSHNDVTCKEKGQLGACSSCLPLWVLCMQPSPAFLQEAVFRTWTHDLMVTRQQLYRCARVPLLFKLYWALMWLATFILVMTSFMLSSTFILVTCHTKWPELYVCKCYIVGCVNVQQIYILDWTE
jgi:hypothetical protein